MWYVIFNNRVYRQTPFQPKMALWWPEEAGNSKKHLLLLPTLYFKQFQKKGQAYRDDS